jgi:HAD superfamily hydrolase (TIGR01484 family)
MQPLASFSALSPAPKFRGLLFDLDDTFLSHGLLSEEAYRALWALHRGGFRLVAVTGRPSGWGEVVARQWPIDGAVTENGAVFLVREGRGIARIEACDAGERQRRRILLAKLVDEVRGEVPEARLADDVDARRSDITWDIGERVTLPAPRVAIIERLIVAAGARTTRSSVHVHATFDADDKASGAVRFLHQRFSEDVGSALATYAFVGDSGNDAACFSAFRTTFGVANVKPYLSRLPVPPRYVARGTMGQGFHEIADALLRAGSAA